jgi:hypothetical protein
MVDNERDVQKMYVHVCRFTAAHSAMWSMAFMDGQHSIVERPQLWWRRFRDFRLAETAELHIFDNPSLCLGALSCPTYCYTTD